MTTKVYKFVVCYTLTSVDNKGFPHLLILANFEIYIYSSLLFLNFLVRINCKSANGVFIIHYYNLNLLVVNISD